MRTDGERETFGGAAARAENGARAEDPKDRPLTHNGYADCRPLLDIFRYFTTILLSKLQHIHTETHFSATVSSSVPCTYSALTPVQHLGLCCTVARYGH